MNEERLLRLADRMDKVKKQHFDISSWYSVEPLRNDGIAKPYWSYGEEPTYAQFLKEKSKIGKRKGGDKLVLLDEGFCGSTACVLGQAALIKEFNKAGLYIDIKSIIENRDLEGQATYIDPKTKEVFEGDQAGAAFFDLPLVAAQMLFYTDAGQHSAREIYGDIDNPKAIAKGLRKTVKTKGQNLVDVLVNQAESYDDYGDGYYASRARDLAAALGLPLPTFKQTA